MSAAVDTVQVAVAVERPTGPRLTDLVGMDEARQFGESLSLDLKDYKAGKIRWSDIDSGCLFYGPPGTGKTTLARAIAAHCGVAFIATSFADWQSGSSGGSDIIASMKETFAAARKSAPCILFLDEVDSLPTRGARDQNASFFQTIVNGALEEIGSPKNRGVIVIAACNDPSNLDPALIRSGRLDQMIEIPLPPPEALPGIFRYHLGIDALNVTDLDRTAMHCIGKSGADIEKIVRESRRLARRSGELLSDDHLLQVITRSASKLSPEELRTTAVHEAGHAVVAFRQGNKAEILISLSAGATFSRPRTDQAGMTREGITAQLVHILAGRAAEDVLLGVVTGGAGGSESSDLARASKIALDAITKHGLSEHGHLMWYEAPMSRLVLETFCGDEVNAWLSEAYGQALAQIRHDAVFVALTARTLLKQGVMSDVDLVSIDNAMKNIPTDMPKSEVLGALGFAPQKPSCSQAANCEFVGD